MLLTGVWLCRPASNSSRPMLNSCARLRAPRREISAGESLGEQFVCSSKLLAATETDGDRVRGECIVPPTTANQLNR